MDFAIRVVETMERAERNHMGVGALGIIL